MARPFVIIRSRGAERFILLGGPLEGTRDVVLIARAESADEIATRLAEDPWARSGHVIMKECRPWILRLGALP